MEEEEDEHDAPTPFRLLLHRAISFWQREEERWEQEMLRAAIENSLISFQESPPPERKPVILPSSVLESDQDGECHLCLEDLKQGDRVAVLPCRHFFHSGCMEELVSHQHLLCPLCRELITTEEKTGSA